MKYLLDTNVWVDYLNQQHPSVATRIRSTNPTDLALSTVVLAELRFGADKSQRSTENHARIDVIAREVSLLDFNSAAAAEFGRLRANLETGGKPIGPYDMLIASQALAHGLILVTDNIDEFGRVQQLTLENWRRG